MEPPYFIIAEQEFSKIRDPLTVTKNDTLAWRTYLVDPNSGQEWCEYYLWDEGHGVGPKCLMRLPEPDTKKLLKICLATKHLDDIIASALRLKDDIQALEDLLEQFDVLSKSPKNEHWLRIGLTIVWASLEQDLNRFPTQGKNYQQVQDDYQRSKTVAEKAKKLRLSAEKKLKTKLSRDISIVNKNNLALL